MAFSSANEFAADIILMSGAILRQFSTAGGTLGKVDVEGNSGGSTIVQHWGGTSNGVAPIYSMRRARGTRAVPVTLSNNDHLGTFNFRGYDGAAMVDAADIRCQAGEAWTTSAHAVRITINGRGPANSAKSEWLRISESEIKFSQSTAPFDFLVANTLGLRFATATTQKLGWWGATPVVQPAAVADATGGTIIDIEARAALNSLLARLRTLGLIAP